MLLQNISVSWRLLFTDVYCPMCACWALSRTDGLQWQIKMASRLCVTPVPRGHMKKVVSEVEARLSLRIGVHLEASVPETSLRLWVTSSWASGALITSDCYPLRGDFRLRHSDWPRAHLPAPGLLSAWLLHRLTLIPLRHWPMIKAWNSEPTTGGGIVMVTLLALNSEDSLFLLLEQRTLLWLSNLQSWGRPAFAAVAAAF